MVNSLYKQTEEYVRKLYADVPHPQLAFHNLAHTKSVVSAAKEIALHSNVNDEEMLVITIAAWFHDTGYLFAEPRSHEEKSVELMRAFMATVNAKEDLVQKVEAAILSTKSPRDPKTLAEQILCDADTYHLGTKDFKETNRQVFQEITNLEPNALTKSEFDQSTIDLLERHTYYTEYAQQKLNAKKQKTMEKKKDKIGKAHKRQLEKEQDHPINETKENGSAEEGALEIGVDKSIRKASSVTSKGIQTMLRLTSSNHIQLSDMADSKANILISVNAIIISIILSVLIRKIQTDSYLLVPSVIFLLTAVITIVLSILATRPKINLGTFSNEDIIAKKTNLLFFGNFHRMGWESYSDAMKVMMRDPDYLYDSIVQDIYHLGVVLGKKYRLLRVAYSIFMFGIIISVVAFALAAYTAPGPGETQTITNSTGSPF